MATVLETLDGLLAPLSKFLGSIVGAPRGLRPLTVVGAVALSAGLIILGILSTLAPAFAATTYGMPSSEAGWVTATGMRDFGIGLSALLLLRNQPAALPSFLVGVLLIPLADVAITAAYGDGLLAAAPHFGGVIAVGVLLIAARGDSGYELADRDIAGRKA